MAVALTPIARARLASALAAKVAALSALPKGGQQAMVRARLARDVVALIAELRGEAVATGGLTAAEKVLIAIASGAHDLKALAATYAVIQEAMGALQDADALTGDAAERAHKAITRWAQLEEKTDV